MSTQHETLQQQAQEPPSRSSSSSHTSELSDDRTTQHSNDQERGRLDNKEDDSDPNNDPPPDGGYGWFIVLATFLSLFAVFGTNISWGMQIMCSILSPRHRHLMCGILLQVSCKITLSKTRLVNQLEWISALSAR